jgi:hypothetical protein
VVFNILKRYNATQAAQNAFRAITAPFCVLVTAGKQNATLPWVLHPASGKAATAAEQLSLEGASVKRVAVV